jgi:hypothetical protein
MKFFWTRTRLIKIFGPGTGPGPDLLNIFEPGPDLLNIFEPGPDLLNIFEPGPGPGC